MKREYIRGNSKYWKDICEYVYGYIPDQINYSYCGDDKIIFVRNQIGKFTVYSNPIIYDAITTNPNWHEIKPWKNNRKFKPFDKVLGWDDDESEAKPDIFLYKGAKDYFCASTFYKHIKLYNEEKYMKLMQKTK